MRQIIKKITAGLLLISMFAASGSAASIGGEASASGVALKVYKKNVALNAGQTVKVRYKAAYRVKVTSSKKKVARASVKKGYIAVKGIKKGKAVITVSCKNTNNKNSKIKNNKVRNSVKIKVVVNSAKAYPLTTATPNPQDIARAARELSPFASAVNKFGMQLYSGIRADNKNTFISPFSVYTALAMLTNGADGNTRAELMNTLGITNLDEVNNLMKNYCQGSMDSEVTFNIANSVWLGNFLEPSKTINDSFINPLKNNYNSEVYKDIAFTEPKTVDTINKWVDTKTKGMIKEIVSSIPDDTVAMIMNALYFQGKWSAPFSESDTKDEIFHGCYRDESIKMMNSSGYYKYFKNDTFTGLELDYGNGTSYSMDILLSTDDKVSTTEKWKSLTRDEQIAQILEFDNRASTKKVRVLKVPKFEMKYESDLVGVLSRMGIKDAFVDGIANFGNIGERLYVSDIIHKTALSVDESGSKAAAVTAIIAQCSSIMIPQKEEEVDFIADRPFVFAIRDKVSGMILFMGEVNSLRQG